MRIAVTGASGYLASVLIPKLHALARVEAILGLDVRPPGAALASLAKLRFERSDVRTADHARLFGTEGPVGRIDAVVHLAFIVAPIADLAAIYDISVAGSERVFEGAAAAGVTQIVYASSIAAHGCVPRPDSALPLREDSPRTDQRDFYYAHTKFLVEEYLDRFERAHPAIAIARMRPGAFVGRSLEGMNQLLDGPLVLGVAGHAEGQYVWDEDVADAFVLALEKRARGAFLVICDDTVPLAETGKILGKPVVVLPGLLVDGLVALADRLAGSGALFVFHRGWIAAARSRTHGTGAKARAELGWKPRCDTSRDALRKFRELSAGARENRGVAILLSGLALLTRATGGRLQMTDVAANMRGLETTVNLDLTGAGGSQWQIRFAEGRIHFARGLAADARSTARIATDAFVRMLAGKLSLSTALFTGQLRIVGEGHAQFLVGGITSLFRQLERAQGLAGVAGRAYAGFILRLARAS